MKRIIVLGAGPAGMQAALRAAELGAQVELVTSGGFGGMAADDGPIPVRALAHAARLMRDAKQLGRYGIITGEPVLDYKLLLIRVREIIEETRAQVSRRTNYSLLGVKIHEFTGKAFFKDPHTIGTESGLNLQADAIILCVGGIGRRLEVPGFELTCTHSDAWSLTTVPPSMLVVGGGDTGAQVASVFSAFGTKVHLLQSGPRILSGADEDISTEVANAFRESGIEVTEDFGVIDSFGKTATGIQMNYSKDGVKGYAEAALAVMAVGWVANTSGLNLEAAGVELNERGFVKVDEYNRTSSPHIFAAGDITGRLMLVPQALQEGFVAATNAVGDRALHLGGVVNPIGSFTDPEYAQVGLIEADARKNHEVLTTVVRFESMARPIIDGHDKGFCKLVIDRKNQRILGCHIMGERAVDIIQLAAVAISANMSLEDFLRIPISFPIYANVLTRAAAMAVRELKTTGQSAHALK
jgi:pyruvate/2-oxoglutarate dehydrogenase complex dihydrolipoamide dehydrogenase (E3) component